MITRNPNRPEILLANGEEGSMLQRTKYLNPRLWPMGVREFLMAAPANRREATIFAVLTCLCVLAPRVRLQYCYDSRKSALLLQLIIEGTQSSGKSFAADIENRILGNTLKLRDQQQRVLEQDYRDLKRRRKANEKLPPEPKTTIRCLPPATSKTMVTRRADAFIRNLGDTMSFWMFTEELQSLSDANKNAYSDLRTIMRLAYDLDAKIGFDFASDNSYSSITDVNIVFMACSTPAALDMYMNQSAIEGGNITRTMLVRLDDELGADGAKFKPLTPEQNACIDKMLDLMVADTYDAEGGLMPVIDLDMSWIDDTVQKWCKAQGRKAALDGSLSRDVFRKRSSSSAFRCAALCYYLYGLENTTREEPLTGLTIQNRCKQIYLFAADYILCNMLDRWGATFEELNNKRIGTSKRQDSRGLYDLLTDTFTRDQLKLLVEEKNLTTPVRQFIYVWKHNGDIEIIDNNHFKKTDRKETSK